MSKKDRQYPPAVCERLDRLSEARVSEIAREDALIKTRKAVKEEFGRIGWGKTDKHKDLALDYVQTVFEIDHSRARQKSLSEKIDDTIRNAHQKELFDHADDIDTLVQPASIDQVVKAVAGGAGEDDDADPDQQDLPVGGPSASEPPKRLRLAPEQPAGIDEHLKASVAELDMRDDLKAACVKAGRSHINGLVVIIDGPDELASMQTTLNVNEKDAKAIIRAVKAYRSAHRGAMRQAESATA
ncbi:MAG: hypothetical protein L6Q35_00570 [Phycisphaerales bacterium]|nr:hypothetical protein [Phycisphaerales bacterium]